MRILSVGNMFPPHSLGGYEVVWKSAVDHLRRQAHEVQVLTTTFELSDQSDHAVDSDVFRELDWYWDRGAWRSLPLSRRIALERHNKDVITRRLQNHRPDVVCFWSMGGMSLSLIEHARRWGASIAFVVCDDWLLYAPMVDAWQRAGRRMPFPGRLLERFTGIPVGVELDRPALWLFCSETTRARARASGLDLSTSAVCHQGVEKKLFSPAPMTPWRGELLYVGRLDPRKGVDLAIMALADLPESTTLRLVGRGDPDYVDSLKKLASSHGLETRIKFACVPRDELRDLYASADVVLFPVKWVEPWGLVPLEAMTVGTPVIASGRGGSGEYLLDGVNCLVCDPDLGPGALATTIERLGSAPELRARLRDGGFETSARLGEHDFDQAVEALLTQTSQ